MKPAPFSATDSVRDNRRFDGIRGFTFTELLVVVGILALLAVTLLPVLAMSRVEPQGTQCASNLRQITMGWLMYADENNGLFPMNLGTGDPGGSGSNILNWAGDIMTFGDAGGGGSADGLLQNTNSLLLTEPGHTQLAPFVKNPAVYRCPADYSTQFAHQAGLPRVRSYAMSDAIGTLDLQGDPRPESPLSAYSAAPGGGLWQTYASLNNMIGGLGPADIWVLVDEDPDTINDGLFTFNMALLPSQTHWDDMPSKYHNDAGNFSFADGHVETHRWQNPNAIETPVYAYYGGPYTPTAANADVYWVTSHTSTAATGF